MNKDDFKKIDGYMWECQNCGQKNFLYNIPNEDCVFICPFCNEINSFFIGNEYEK